VEILKALYRNVKVLILDEPTAVLVPQEVDDLFDSLEKLRETGLSVVFISHKLNEVMAVCDRITVLRGWKGSWYSQEVRNQQDRPGTFDGWA
jgi:general nucleoside transport system ATP-binding protein